MNSCKRLCPLTLVLLSALLIDARSSSANELLQAAGVNGGLVVHLGCGGGELTAELRANDGCLVQGLDTDAANVDKARQRFQSLGLSGRVTADTFDGERLPFTDNLVNLLIVTDRSSVPKGEMLRVLAPYGVALVKATGSPQPELDGQTVEIGGKTWLKVVKPWPGDIDEWTHYLHGPDNNAVAHDTVVGPPRRMQWLASPEWTRSHHKLCSISSVVTAKGRLFYILDEATAANINVPGKWGIIARDAFSGVTLWKKPMESWAWHQLRFRSGPPQVTRLLVVSGDRLYAPLGLNAPVSAMDAITGKTLKTFEETAAAEEIILTDGVLLVLKGDPVAEHASGHTAFRGQLQAPNKKTIVALDAESGRTLWTWSDPKANPLPETLGSDGRKVYFQLGEGVACLDLKSGKALWTYAEDGQKRETASKKSKKNARAKAKKKNMNFGTNTLVIADDVVLCKLSDQLTALSARDGRKLWECNAGGGFHAPLDIFVIDGLVWEGKHVSDSVSPPPVQDFNEGRDLHTGEVKVRNAVQVDLQTSGHHHRCYREKATDRFIITGKRGIEMMDLAGSSHSRNNWVRGACQYGILPANGLIYAPSHACGCYMESKLRGFWALAAEGSRATGPGSRAEQRLERGPAFGQALDPGPSTLDRSWPLYRHDPLRSGVASTVVPIELRRAWKTKLGGRLTQPVVADGKVVLAAVDENVVYALDEKSGKVLWKHMAGGRVDSPPSLYKGMALFGSADGRVTCLRLNDGALVWRFLAAREDTKAVALDQLESVWPVHGSVLLLDGVAYCSAGRSTWMDGGIDLYGLEPATGKVVHKTRFESQHPEFAEGKDKATAEQETRIDQNTTDYKTFLASDRSDAFSMAGGAVSDVLVSDGKNVFLHHVTFNARLQKQDKMSRHLFSTSSLLDDSESHRSHWVLGTGDFSRIPVAYSWIVNRPGKRMPTIAVPTGVTMIFDDNALWGTRRQGDSNGRYRLFMAANKPFSADEEFLPDFRRLSAEEMDRDEWKTELPVRAKAMLKSGDHLYLGVLPVEIPAEDPHAAYENRRGGMIWVCSAKDGSKVAEYKLESPVVWDGMAAANEKLFLSTSDGSIQCFAGVR